MAVLDRPGGGGRRRVPGGRGGAGRSTCGRPARLLRRGAAAVPARPAQAAARLDPGRRRARPRRRGATRPSCSARACCGCSGRWRADARLPPGVGGPALGGRRHRRPRRVPGGRRGLDGVAAGRLRPGRRAARRRARQARGRCGAAAAAALRDGDRGAGRRPRAPTCPPTGWSSWSPPPTGCRCWSRSWCGRAVRGCRRRSPRWSSSGWPTLDDDAAAVLRAAAVLGADPPWTLLPQVADRPEPVGVGGAAGGGGRGPAGRGGRRAALAARAHLRRGGGHRAAPRAGGGRPPGGRSAARRGGSDDDVAGRGAAGRRRRGRAGGRRSCAAARRDLARGALRSAEALLDRVPAAHAADGRGRPGGAADRGSGRAADALDAGERALPAATGDAHAELCLRLARAAVRAGQWQRARSYVDRAGRPDGSAHVAVGGRRRVRGR